jgi:hypothetical protein
MSSAARSDGGVMAAALASGTQMDREILKNPVKLPGKTSGGK